MVTLKKYNEDLKTLIDNDIANVTSLQAIPSDRSDYVYGKIMNEIDVKPDSSKNLIRRRMIRRWASVAAAVAVLFAAGTLIFFQRQISPKGAFIALIKDDISPGGNRATLTLADGSIIDLDKTGTGSLATQGGAEIMKSNDGEVVYESRLSNLELSNSQMIKPNTLATPVGGQYQLTLSDGTKVWLNAASSIKFPANFSGKERRVSVTGETYFEVSKNVNMPFIVEINEAAEVKVLGTHFNIHAYNDENIMNVTLLEGSVQVSPAILDASEGSVQNSVILKPGQQSEITSDGKMTVKYIDEFEAVAWKEGLFRFNDAGFDEIVPQLERWYNVKFIFEDTIPHKRVTGYVSRNVNISKVLEMLEYTTGLKFRIENNKVIINSGNQ
jgi:ferric-dicitrate binding protein FerR (iron transport regulator)